MNLNQWRFFVIATKELEAKLGQQKTLGLATLQTLNAREAKYSNLAEVVEYAAGGV